jgi:hypothetical protein
MRIADHLSEQQKKQLNNLRPKNTDSRNMNKDKKLKRIKEEKIDWHDMMGSNRQILKRGKGGAWR